MDWKQELMNLFNQKQDIYAFMQSHATKEIINHLSPVRFNFLAWFDFKSDMSVLEINGGTGAITQGYIEKVKHVDFYESDESLLEIAKVRFDAYDHIDYMHSLTFNQHYDLIIIAEAFELDQMDELMKHTDHLIIAFDNPYGLSRLAGNISYHESNPFEALSHHEGYTKQAVEKKLKQLDCSYRFYYPTPDYRFASEIYSDGHLPKLGDLYGYGHDYALNKHISFDENQVRDFIIEDGKFVEYANSYIVEVESHVVL